LNPKQNKSKLVISSFRKKNGRDMKAKTKYILWGALILYSILIFGLNLNEPGLYSTQEGRAGISAKNMLKTGEYTRVHIKHAHNTEKPILCYWLYTLSCKIFGFTEIGVRLPSVIAGILAVLMTCYLGMKIYGPATGFLSGFILSSTICFANQARIARIDVVLTAFFLLCMILFYKGYLEKKKANWIMHLFYIVLAFSVLVKGPVTVALAGLTIFFFAWKEKNWKILWEVKPISGLIIGLIIAAPWFVYEGIKSEGAFTWDFFINQNIKRFIGGSNYCEGNRKIFLFYFPNLFQGFFPWSVFTPLALITLWRKLLKLRSETNFLAIWILSIFCFFSLSAIKRTDYILPLYPALAILTARFIDYMKEKKMELTKHWIWLWLAGVALVLFVLTTLRLGVMKKLAEIASQDKLPFFGSRDGDSILHICDSLEPYFWLFALSLSLTAVFFFICGKLFEKKQPIKGSYAFIIAFLFFHSLFVLWIQPETDKYKSVKTFILRAKKHVPPDKKIIFFKIWNTEAIFYMDRDYYAPIWQFQGLCRLNMKPIFNINKDYYKPLREFQWLCEENNRELLYDYILCPANQLDDIPPSVRNQRELLEQTIEGHQYPMALLGPKNNHQKRELN
jgi:hypothetical protein